MQIGLKPEEVLDMSLEVFRACSEGYADHLTDLEILSVQQGYWVGYYSNSKRPKSVKSIIDRILRSREKGSHASEVDVESFLERERRFTERLNNKT